MRVLRMRLEGVDRGDIDNAARDVRHIDELSHMQNGGHHHVIGALDVDGVFQIPVFIRDFKDWLARIDGCAVDERMHAA